MFCNPAKSRFRFFSAFRSFAKRWFYFFQRFAALQKYENGFFSLLQSCNDTKQVFCKETPGIYSEC